MLYLERRHVGVQAKLHTACEGDDTGRHGASGRPSRGPTLAVEQGNLTHMEAGVSFPRAWALDASQQ